MFRCIFLLPLLFALIGCYDTDLIKSLVYADNSNQKKVDISQINFNRLNSSKQGKSCVGRLLNIPIQGSSSILDATKNGSVNNVFLIGYQTHWFFLFSKQCIVVFEKDDSIFTDKKINTIIKK